MTGTYLDDLSDEDRRIIFAVGDLSISLAHTLKQLRPKILAKYNLSPGEADLAVSAAVIANTSDTARKVLEGFSSEGLDKYYPHIAAMFGDAILEIVRSNTTTVLKNERDSDNGS